MQENKDFEFTPFIIALPLFFVITLWIVFWIEVHFGFQLTEYGIYPRTLSGLRGIVFSPFLHGDLKHLYNNSIPLLFLLWVLRYFYEKKSLQIVIYGVFISGFLTWIIGRPSYHIGASGLIYVLISFIFFKGMMAKKYQLMALSLVVVFLYGGLIWYAFPNVIVEDGVSWEGHLAGFITGFFLALIYKTDILEKIIKYDWEHLDFNPQRDPFMRHFDEKGNFIRFPQQTNTGGREAVYNFIGYKITRTQNVQEKKELFSGNEEERNL